jgi:hypothetical protein
MSRAVRVVDGFAPEARALRRVFDARFADPRKAGADRFVWDWWHVPGQYTQLRTPAWRYFPPALYRAIHERLVGWGRAQLGCHDISPPWLSLYVDGCGQELHGDLPHGPWAFVLSLTPWERRVFRGGETVMVKDEVLDYWRDFVSVRSVEEVDLIRAIPPRFGRLVVFDPRIPHGVRRVTGTSDPREGRLVINGWFVQPRPFVEGPVPAAAVAARIDELGAQVGAWTADTAIAGMVALAIRIAPTGRVRAVDVLSDTTRIAGPQGDDTDRRRLLGRIRSAVRAWQLPRRARGSRVTLPLVFERA